MAKKQEEGLAVGRPAYGFTKTGEQDPGTPPVVKGIYDLAINGHRLAHIVKCLNNEGILSSTGRTWSIPGIKKILGNPKYRGTIIDANTFDQVQETLGARKPPGESEKAPDVFPMAVCGVCNKKLVYSRVQGTYLCDRHTGDSPIEKRLEAQPRIRDATLEQEVMRRYKEFLTKLEQSFCRAMISRSQILTITEQ